MDQMEYMLFMVLFIILVAGIYTLCTQSDEDADKNKSKHPTEIYSDETPAGTVW
jgi:hypothetical protein